MIRSPTPTSLTKMRGYVAFRCRIKARLPPQIMRDLRTGERFFYYRLSNNENAPGVAAGYLREHERGGQGKQCSDFGRCCLTPDTIR
jgi:hypothetical protein